MNPAVLLPAGMLPTVMTPALTAAIGAAVLGPLTLWLSRRTMCRSWRPGRAEIAAVVALAGVAAQLAAGGTRDGLAGVPLALIGPAAAVVDAREGRLPDLLTVPLLAATTLLTVLDGRDRARLLLLAAAVLVVGVAVAVLARDALGWGDVKLLPTVVLVLGGDGALTVGLLWIVALTGVTTLLVWARDRRSLVPYGPALVVGTLAAAGV